MYVNILCRAKCKTQIWNSPFGIYYYNMCNEYVRSREQCVYHHHHHINKKQNACAIHTIYLDSFIKKMGFFFLSTPGFFLFSSIVFTNLFIFFNHWKTLQLMQHKKCTVFCFQTHSLSLVRSLCFALYKKVQKGIRNRERE